MMSLSDVKATLSFSDGSPNMELPIYKGTVGPDVMQAYYRMEVLEMYARVRLVTRILGEPKPLSPDEVSELHKVRERQGWGRAGSAEPELVDLIARVVVEVMKKRDNPW